MCVLARMDLCLRAESIPPVLRKTISLGLLVNSPWKGGVLLESPSPDSQYWPPSQDKQSEVHCEGFAVLGAHSQAGTFSLPWKVTCEWVIDHFSLVCGFILHPTRMTNLNSWSLSCGECNWSHPSTQGFQNCLWKRKIKANLFLFFFLELGSF